MNPLEDMAKQTAAKGYRICGEATRPPIASVPRLNAVAFSMAGIPSDAFDRRQQDARLLYRDSGKRYEFKIVDGRVTVDPARDGPKLTRHAAGAGVDGGNLL